MGVTAQDKKIAGLIQKAYKPCLLAVNKWDLIKPDERDRDFLEAKIQEIRDNLFFLDYAPVVLLSAKTGENMSRLFRFIEQVREDAKRKIGTGPLNRLIQTILSANPPAIRSGKRFKVLYATQVERTSLEPIPIPRFLLFVNDPDVLAGSYRKYFESQLREEARFMGLPIALQMRGREQRGKENQSSKSETRNSNQGTKKSSKSAATDAKQRPGFQTRRSKQT